MQNNLNKSKIRELKALMEQFQDSAANKTQLADKIEENLQDILELANMAENALDLEFENERLKSKLEWNLKGMKTLDM